MDDRDLIDRINALGHEEHELWEKEGRQEANDDDRKRLSDLEVTLDQCWDLLHQRRARRNAGLDPNDAEVRPPEVVERYLS